MKYKQNRGKGIDNSGGAEGDSNDKEKMNSKLKRVNRIVSILTQFSLLLGFLIFLFLWLL